MDVLGVAKAWGRRAVTPADSTRGKVLQFVALLDVALLVLFKWNLIVDLFILFDAEGVELVLVPVERYALTGLELAFGDVVAAARERGHVAVGVRIVSAAVEGGLAGGGVLFNPPKARRFAFTEDDQILVLA